MLEKTLKRLKNFLIKSNLFQQILQPVFIYLVKISD